MKPAMDCREARAHAPLFVGEDLESDALEAVRGHLQACAECASQVAALERALRAFEVERVRVDPRVDLWSNIERELAQSGHLRPAHTAGQSLVASNVAPVAVPLSTAAVATDVDSSGATRAPALAPRRTLAGARRWFAVAAAAAVAAFLINGWLGRETGRPDSPSGAQFAPGGTGTELVRNSQPEFSSPSGRAVGAEQAGLAAGAEQVDSVDRVSTGAPAALVADASNPSGASDGQGVRLAAAVPSAPPAAEFGAAAAAPAPVRHEGLRRVNGDEALLRDNLERWSVQGLEGGYSLVRYPVTR